MVGTNDIKPFGSGTGANILPPDQWSALAARQNGFSSGLADSTQCNTAWHQSSLIAAMIGQFIANADLDALDNGDSAALLANFVTALGRSIRLYVGTDTGSANHIVANVTPDLATYGALNVFVIRSIAANSTGPVDANFDSKGVRGVRRRDGQPLVNGDLAAGSVLILVDDGTYLRCLAPVASELVTNLLTTPGSQAAFNSQYVRIEAKRFAGTNPMVLETFFKPVWLNTIYDNQAGVSLSGANDNPPYTISLPVAGTWRADILAVGRSCGGMYCDLQAVATQGGLTNGQVLAHGCMIDSYPAGADAVAVPSLGVGRFVTTGPAKICLVARKTETEANNSALGDDTVTFEGNTDAYVILTREIGSP